MAFLGVIATAHARYPATRTAPRLVRFEATWRHVRADYRQIRLTDLHYRLHTNEQEV